MSQTSTNPQLRALLQQAAPFAMEARRLPPVSAGTMEQYEGAARRAMAGQPIGTVPGLPSTSKNSWSLTRAALARVSRVRLHDALASVALGGDAQDIEVALRTWLPVAIEFSYAPVDDARKPRQGSRRSLGSKKKAAAGLPGGWLDELWSLASSRRDGKPAKCLDALAVCIVSGCRPAELEHGVSVDLADGLVVLRIRGAKVTDAHGQPWRMVTVGVDTAPARHLACLAAGGAVTVTYGASAFSDSVRDIAGSRWTGSVSAYDIRHARAADASVSMDADDRARMLGHTRRETGGYYGRGKKGRALALSGGELESVEAPRAVLGRDYSPARTADTTATFSR